LAQLRDHATHTLEPCMRSHGLTATTVTAVTDQGSPVTLTLSDALGPSMSTPADEDQIAEVLFILDKFGVSDECYHELAQVTNTTLFRLM